MFMIRTRFLFRQLIFAFIVVIRDCISIFQYTHTCLRYIGIGFAAQAPPNGSQLLITHRYLWTHINLLRCANKRVHGDLASDSLQFSWFHFDWAKWWRQDTSSLTANLSSHFLFVEMPADISWSNHLLGVCIYTQTYLPLLRKAQCVLFMHTISCAGPMKTRSRVVLILWSSHHFLVRQTDRQTDRLPKLTFSVSS